jgi:hypothetical protein
MQRFQFHLESVLGWRKAQFDLEELRLQTLFSELEKLAEDQRRIATDRVQSNAAVKIGDFVERDDLIALDSFDQFSESQRLNFERRRQDCGIRIAAQQTKVMEAQRQFRLLEKLKERKLTDWTRQFDAEQEALAGEMYLARLSRSQGGQ